MSDDLRSLRGGWLETALQRLLSALWVTVIPALLAAAVLRYFVPPVDSGVGGWVARAGHSYGLLLGLALFLAFSAVVRHWRYYLPGGRYASVLPADLVGDERDPDRLAEWASHASLYEGLRAKASSKSEAPSQPSDTVTQLVALRSAIAAGDLQRARAARRAVETSARPILVRARTESVWLWTASLVAAVSIALVAKARIVGIYQVNSTSMLPTLEPNDQVGGLKEGRAFAPASWPRRADIVVFRRSAVALPPQADLTDVPDLLIKRVIGFPGDRIRMVGGAPSINGWRVPSCDAGEYLYVLPEPSGKAAFGRLHVEFLDDRAYLALYPLTEGAAPTEYAVKKDEVFVLGDNRKNSIDSRVFASGKGGGVALTAIEGRASRFLIGSRRGGDFDFARWLAPIDRPLAAPGLAGFASDGVEQAVRRCLANRPKGTTPPSPLEGVSLASAGDAP